MKSSFDLKHNIARITPQTREDLEILKEVLKPGIFVTAKSPRSIKIKRGGELIRAKTGRKEVLMKILVEKIELAEKLRLNGKIVEIREDFDKGYHTIEIEPGKFFTVEREWKSWEIDRIKAAERRPEPILVCVLDDMEADLFMIKERYKHLVNIRSEITGKRFDTKEAENKRKEYHDNIIKKIVNRSEQVKKIIIAGPAFEKENLYERIKLKEKKLVEKIIIEQTFQTSELGLQELLKKGLLEKLTKISRITEESKAVEELLEEIGKDGKAVYGLEDTRNAIESGLVRLLLVSVDKISEFEEVLDEADKLKTRIMVISSEHPSGRKLSGLGGIAGLIK
jgi:protein pelota